MSLEGRHFKWVRPFGPYIVQTTISDELHKLLLKGSKKVRNNKKLKKKNDYRNRLAGNLSEEYSFADAFTIKERQIINTELRWLASEFTKAGEKLQPGFGKNRIGSRARQPEDILIHEPAWVNFMKAGEWNPAHNHTGDISCVMYLKVPKEIEQENKTATHTSESNTPTAGRIEFKYGDNIGYCVNGVIRRPQEKDIYLFPAGLCHLVYPFKSKVERISISVNFSDKISHYQMLLRKPPKSE